MQAILEPATSAPASTTNLSLKPTVTYDLSLKEIHVQVIVFRKDDGSIDHITPPCAVPHGGLWKVYWDVVGDISLDGALPPAIEVLMQTSQKPDAVTDLSDPSFTQDQGRVSLTNQVLDVNSISYRIQLAGTQPHDPTIAVVKDPLEPPV